MSEVKLRPIDKSKKSNRRCWNCEFYPKDFSRCKKSDRVVDYWNCCKHFIWSSEKTYKEERGKNNLIKYGVFYCADGENKMAEIESLDRIYNEMNETD